MNDLPIKGRRLFEHLQGLITEASNPKSIDLDRLSTSEILKLINTEDATVAATVNSQIPQIAQAVEIVERTLRDGGRLIYMGAGTSGRLGVLDAAECPPTFGIEPGKIIGLIAGGPPTLIRSAEGIEDDMDAGKKDISDLDVCSTDVVMGLTTSSRTPYVIAGLDEAKKRGAKTIFLCCNPSADFIYQYDLLITPIVGPEVLSGSTRMKAALAEKMVLTMLTTTVMVKLGKVYKNMMVDLQATSQKLVERSKRVIMAAVNCDYSAAGEYLAAAEGHVKTAIVMAKIKTSKQTRVPI
jgi:N-acetylmuramic acid 6-phosphate etherase